MEGKDRKFKAAYRIGEISKILGMHPQTIRYYDKVGFVLPETENQKKERMYASYDAYMIMIRKQYQNMGFSIQETEKIFYEDDIEDITGRLEYQIEANKRELQNQQYLLTGMIQLKEIIASIPTYHRRCFYRIRPARWHHLHLQDDILDNTENGRLARKIGMEAMPLCKHTLGIRKSDIESGKDVVSTYCDLTIEDTYADFYGFSKIPSAFYMEAKPCIYTILSVESYDSVKWSYLDYVMDFIKFNQLEIDGDVELVTIVNALQKTDQAQEKERFRYFEVWVPIKDRVQ